jgi:hypothetical protein
MVICLSLGSFPGSSRSSESRQIGYSHDASQLQIVARRCGNAGSCAAEANAARGHPHNDEYLWRCGDEPRVRSTQQDRGVGSATRLMDRTVDHSSAKWLKNMAERVGSNPAYNVVSIT